MLYNRRLCLLRATFDTENGSRLVANKSEMAENRYRGCKKVSNQQLFIVARTTFDDETKRKFSPDLFIFKSYVQVHHLLATSWRDGRRNRRRLAVHAKHRHHFMSVTLALWEQQRVMEWPCDVCPRLNFIRAESVTRLLCVAVKPRSFTSSIRSNRPEIACSGLCNKLFRDKPHSLLSRLSIERVTNAVFPRTAVVIEKLVESGKLREIHTFLIKVHSKRD